MPWHSEIALAIHSLQLPSSNCPESFLLLLDAETLCLMDTENCLMLFFIVSEPNSHLHANHATFQEHKNCHQLQPLWYITSFTPVLCQGDHRNNDVYMTATLSRVLGADAASSATYHLPRFPHISELRIWKVKKHVSSANISIFMVGAEKFEMLRIPPEHLSCQSHWIPLGHHL